MFSFVMEHHAAQSKRRVAMSPYMASKPGVQFLLAGFDGSGVFPRGRGPFRSPEDDARPVFVMAASRIWALRARATPPRSRPRAPFGVNAATSSRSSVNSPGGRSTKCWARRRPPPPPRSTEPPVVLGGVGGFLLVAFVLGGASSRRRRPRGSGSTLSRGGVLVGCRVAGRGGAASSAIDLWRCGLGGFGGVFSRPAGAFRRRATSPGLTPAFAPRGQTRGKRSRASGSNTACPGKQRARTTHCGSHVLSWRKRLAAVQALLTCYHFCTLDRLKSHYKTLQHSTLQLGQAPQR